MTYTETEAARLLKECNQLIYKNTQHFFKAKSENVRKKLQLDLKFLSDSADEIAKIRTQEIEEERREQIELSSGLSVTKGLFIDTQSKNELSDEETEDYPTMCYLDSLKNGKTFDTTVPPPYR